MDHLSSPLTPHIPFSTRNTKMLPSGDHRDPPSISAAEPPIHGDVLESILSHLPLLHLVPKSLVSKPWNNAVNSTLLKTTNSTPWLIIYIQSSRSPYLTKTVAYDPASRTWIEIQVIQQPSIEYVSSLRSSQPNLLYMISPSRFSFSFDPLHLNWHHAVAPRVWRIDPLVAVVGNNVVVAGGACDFENDPLAVEIYDVEAQTWSKPEPMPEFFKHSASPSWHSIASDDRRLYVLDKTDCLLHTFDPSTNNWSGPYDLLPDEFQELVFHANIGFCDEKLILIGMLGDCENVNGIKMWKVRFESCDSSDSNDLYNCDEICEMPVDLVEKLKGDELELTSIEVRMGGKFVYVYRPERAEEVVVCEFSGDGGCRWWSEVNAVAVDRSLSERFVFSCVNVGVEELRRASRSTANRRFRFKR